MDLFPLQMLDMAQTIANIDMHSLFFTANLSPFAFQTSPYRFLLTYMKCVYPESNVLRCYQKIFYQKMRYQKWSYHIIKRC